METYKQHPQYKSYEISDMGSVRNIKTQRIMKQRGNRYSQINLRVEKNQITRLVHRLVVETFIGDIPEGNHIDHIDRNGLNNKLSNLRIVTPKQNCHNRVMVGKDIPHIIYNSHTKTFSVNGDSINDIGEALNKFKKSI